MGPASTVAVHCSSPPRVEVRTEGEAVQELGQRIARLVLTPQQIDLLNKDPALLFINGPPGTGRCSACVPDNGYHGLHSVFCDKLSSGIKKIDSKQGRELKPLK